MQKLVAAPWKTRLLCSWPLWSLLSWHWPRS